MSVPQPFIKKIQLVDFFVLKYICLLRRCWFGNNFWVIELTKLFNKKYALGNIIECMCHSVFIILPKAEGTMECKNQRIIIIMSQVTKILLRMILKSVTSKTKPELSEEHIVLFSKNRTRNTIFCLRTIAEVGIEMYGS